MREIKFRVWYEGNYTYFDLDLLNRESRSFYKNEIKNTKVEQYTGLKDKNGVEIYEGDKLVHIDRPRDSAIVRFSVGAFYCGEMLVNTYAPSVIEVIGNIHEGNK